MSQQIRLSTVSGVLQQPTISSLFISHGTRRRSRPMQ